MNFFLIEQKTGRDRFILVHGPGLGKNRIRLYFRQILIANDVCLAPLERRSHEIPGTTPQFGKLFVTWIEQWEKLTALIYRN